MVNAFITRHVTLYVCRCAALSPADVVTAIYGYSERRAAGDKARRQNREQAICWHRFHTISLLPRPIDFRRHVTFREALAEGDACNMLRMTHKCMARKEQQSSYRHAMLMSRHRALIVSRPYSRRDVTERRYYSAIMPLRRRDKRVTLPDYRQELRARR